MSYGAIFSLFIPPTFLGRSPARAEVRSTSIRVGRPPGQKHAVFRPGQTARPGRSAQHFDQGRSPTRADRKTPNKEKLNHYSIFHTAGTTRLPRQSRHHCPAQQFEPRFAALPRHRISRFSFSQSKAEADDLPAH